MTKAQEIAKYIVETGTKETTTGNYIFEFDEINERFGVNIPDDENLYYDIIDALYEYADMIGEIEDPLKRRAFDIVFYLENCPNAEDFDDNY